MATKPKAKAKAAVPKPAAVKAAAAPLEPTPEDKATAAAIAAFAGSLVRGQTLIGAYNNARIAAKKALGGK